MTEVTQVPQQPIARGSLAKLWLGVVAAILLAAGIAWLAMPPGVSVDEVTAGEGDPPALTDVVFVKYTGRLEDGTVFDQSQGQPWPVPGILPDGAALPLGQMIPGFQQAITQMRKGGTYEVFIPSEMGYGANSPPGSPIPPNSDLYFNIELVDFMSEQEAQQRYMTMVQMMQQAEGAPGAEGAEGGAAGGAAPAPAPQGAAPAPAPAQGPPQ